MYIVLALGTNTLCFQVLDHSLDVLILELGVVKRVYVDRLGVVRHQFRRMSGVAYLDLWWPGDSSPLTMSVLRRVHLTLSKGEKPHDFVAVIDRPEHGEEELIQLD